MTMPLPQLKKKLPGLAEVDGLTSWEMEEHLARLAGCTEQAQREILRQVAVIWPVSHALCASFLDQVPKGLACLSLAKLPEWVNAILDVYEKEGLQQACRFMAEVETNFVHRLGGENGLTLTEASSRLLPYIRGLAGRDLALAGAPETYTDGQTIFLPPEITLFLESRLNFLAYKLFATFQWGLLTDGTFSARPDAGQPLIRKLTHRYGQTWQEQKPFPASFCSLFPEPRLATDLFGLLETLRISHLLQTELPGLMRDSLPVRQQLYRLRPDPARLAGKALLVEALGQWVLARRTKSRWPAREERIFARAVRLLTSLAAEGGEVEKSMVLTAALYRLFEELPGGYEAGDPLPLIGRLNPAAVLATRLRRRQEAAQRFIKALGAILPTEISREAAPVEETAATSPPAAIPVTEGLAMLTPARDGQEEKKPPGPEGQQSPEYLVIGGQEFKIPEKLQPLAREIRADLGHIPERYISAALQHAGTAPVRGPGPVTIDGQAASGRLVYDEWDYRRAGFRKNWCQLVEKELPSVRGTFVENTLTKYRGQLRQLKRQFEMMRLQQRYLKRQKEGDEIDLDAAIDALADARAGGSPSEKLFIRLDRDERNVAAVFLVDMSSSTEGWVSTALKEALTLMSEALEVLGDRYAIYGFSGMRRLRSEIYHIKHLNERLDQEVRGRIAAITPRDYTRMGPPIRHVTRMLAATDAKVRLIITLSDGKPEDYDDYKGDYAIEDTRHALIEAKAAAIHPFCITIDQESHAYIPHMYGAVNYCFIDDVKKLPLRMPGIYRALTT
jgi:nitric oxide reductase NorD protein